MVWPAWIIYAIVQLVVSIALIELTARTPKSALKAKGLDDFDFPTATEDRAIPYIVGKVLVKGANLTWYGDLATKKLTEKVKKGISNHKNVTVGFQYYIGMELALCWGKVDKLSELWFEDKQAWVGSVTTDSGFRVNNQGLFGGKKNGGGVLFNCAFKSGSMTQTVSPYMAAVAGFPVAPYGYRHLGLCKLILEGPTGNTATGGGFATTSRHYRSGLIGETPSVPQISPVLERYPAHLGLASNMHILPSGANPAEVIYELLTGKYIPFSSGLIVPRLEDYEVDLASFLAAGATLYAENMGINFQWQRDTGSKDLIEDVLFHINGILRENPNSGKVELVLLRDDYVIGDLPVFDRSNVVQIDGLQRQTVYSLVNRVNYSFTERSDNYPTRKSSVFSTAGLFMTNQESTVEMDLTMFSDGAVANKRAQQHLNSICSPAFSGTMVCDSRAWDMKIGDRFVLNYDSGDPDIAGVTNIVGLVNRVSISSLERRRISLGFVQDVFSIGSAIFVTPEDPGWEDPISDPEPVAEYKIYEVPYGLLNGASPTILGVFAVAPNQSTTYAEVGFQTNGGGYAMEEDLLVFSPFGSLLADLPAQEELISGAYNFSAFLSPFIYDAETADVDAEFAEIDYLTTGLTSAEIHARKCNLFLIGDEIIGIKSWTVPTEDTYEVQAAMRGMYGTIPANHLTGDRMWYLGQAFIMDREALTTGTDWDMKFSTYSYRGFLGLDAVPAVSDTVAGVANLPYPPGDLYVDSQPWSATGTIPVVFSWFRRNKAGANYHASQNDSPFSEDYRLRIYNDDTDALLRTEDLLFSVLGAANDGFTYDNTMWTTDGSPANIRVELSTVIAAVESLPVVWVIAVS
jgi:hypothetical protein